MMRAAVLLAAITPLALGDYHPAAVQEFFASPVPRAIHRAALFEVTDMSNLFEYETSFNEDIGAWETSGVTSMNNMFYEASSFNRDIGGCLLYTSPSPRDQRGSRMPSSA